MAVKTLRYKVSGAGAFPLDMLRYDRVYPFSEVDSNAMEYSPKRRTVEVIGSGCTKGRWESFLWKVEA